MLLLSADGRHQLRRSGDCLITSDGAEAARVVDGIVQYSNWPVHGVDLHIDEVVVDIYEALATRVVRGRKIVSGVEWAAARHSFLFPDRHARELAPYLSNGCILADLGCGQAPYLRTFPLRKIGAYYGFDGHLPSLHIATRQYGENHRLVFVLWPLTERLPLCDEACDAVISSEVIEHVKDPHSYLREANRILRRDGILSLSTPCGSMYLWPSEILKIVVGRVQVRTMWQRLTPERRWDCALKWHPAIRPSVLRNWLNKAGFEIVRHTSTLWNCQTALRPVRRMFGVAELLIGDRAGLAFDTYLSVMGRLIEANVPILRFAGLRQFVLARKAS